MNKILRLMVTAVFVTSLVTGPYMPAIKNAVSDVVSYAVGTVTP